MPTALEIAQGRQTPLSAGLFMAILEETPLLSMFDVRTTSGTRFLSLAVVSLPDSKFANLGEGFESSNGKLELREFNCALIGGLIMAEVISSERWDAEHQASGFSWFDLQTELKFLADAKNIERQIIKGTSNASGDGDKGFPGSLELTPFETGNVIDFGAGETAASGGYKKSVLDVGGTTNGEATSVHSFVHGEMDCQLVVGGVAGASSELVTLRDIRRQIIAPDPVNEPAKRSEHDLAQLDGWLGMSVAGFNQQVTGQPIPTQFSVRRAANITTEAGKTVTDEVMDKLARSHKTGKRPHLFAMSQRSGEQLAKSRTPGTVTIRMGDGDAAINQANIQPDPPEDWRGIPIAYPEPDVIADDGAIEAV